MAFISRLLVSQQRISVDGYASDRTDEGDVFPVVGDFSESEKHNVGQISSVDQVLLGRRTYELFVDFWPDANDVTMAKQIKAVPKVVYSATLDAVQYGDFTPTSLARNAEGDVHKAKKVSGGDPLHRGDSFIQLE